MSCIYKLMFNEKTMSEHDWSVQIGNSRIIVVDNNISNDDNSSNRTNRSNKNNNNRSKNNRIQRNNETLIGKGTTQIIKDKALYEGNR